MTDTKNPITPTYDEKKLAKDVAFAVCFTEQYLLLEGESGRHQWESLMKTQRDKALDRFKSKDLTKIDAVMLYHDAFLGEALNAYYEDCAEHTHIDDIVRVDAFFANPIKARGAMGFVQRFQPIKTWGELCQDEIGRRSSQMDPALACFVALLPFGADLDGFPYSKADPAIVNHVRSMIPNEDFKSKYKVETIHDSLSGLMRNKFVASEKHTTEHDNEKKSIIFEAIALVQKQQLKNMETNPTEYLYQLAAILNGESKWNGQNNPLAYFPNRIPKEFIKIVEKQVSNGKHWDDPTADGEAIDAYDIQALDKEFWREEKMKWQDGLDTLPADSNPEKEVCNGNIENLIDEIENADSQLGKVARVYFEAYMEDKKRPTQLEVADCLEVTDRTVRNHLQKLSVFLEKK